MFKKLKRFVRAYSLRGNNVECCICQKQFLTFLPSGDEIKAHSRCPGCYSTDRNRQLWLILQPLLKDIKKKFHILHVAPEHSLGLKLLKMKQVHYHAIDKFEKGYNYPAHVIAMDLTALDFEDNLFDFFLCSHVLEHITNDKKAIQELYRVLKPGGTGFIMIPYFPQLPLTYEDFSINTPEQRKLKFGQADHVRKYGLDFSQKLNETGFELEILSFENKYNSEQKVRMGLINAELIFQVKKNN